MTPFYLVSNPINSKFTRTLQAALKVAAKSPVYRRRTPKCVRRRILPFLVTTPPALNKIEQFNRQAEAGVPTPGYCTSKDGVRQSTWTSVFARTLVNSTNGRGIVEFRRDDEDYPDAPLFTEYVPKVSEYRYHVFNGEVIDVQQKRKRTGFVGDRNTRVRNVRNGYVYCRDGVDHDPGVADLAIRAVKACGYVYGAVDIIYNRQRNQHYVLEVNTRPGLTGTTLTRYIAAIINSFNLEKK